MEYIDLRKIGREGLKEIRRQEVRLKKMGKTGKEIEELTGVRQNRASEIWTRINVREKPLWSEKRMDENLGHTWFLRQKNKRIYRKRSKKKGRKISGSLVNYGPWAERGNTSKSG